MTWLERWAIRIHEAVKDLPDNATLKERTKAVDDARPCFGGTSWPKKAWQAARRDYLMRYGYEPKTKKQKDRQKAVVGELPLFAGGEAR